MDYFIGEIRLFPFAAIPKGWVACNGQIFNMQQNQALYSLLGNYYGGSVASNTFGLPNLNGTVIVGTGVADTSTSYQLGNAGAGGAESIALTIPQMPAHNHFVIAANSYDTNVPTSNFLGNPNIPTSNTQTRLNPAGSSTNMYNNQPTVTTLTSLNSASITNAGSGAVHENRQPFMPMMYCIAITGGLYPSRP